MPAFTHTDALVRLSRRSLWTAFILIAAIGATGILQLATPAAHAAHHLGLLLPVLIVIAAASLRGSAPGMAIVLADELRQAALARASRVALFAVLILQPVLAVGLTVAGAPQSVALMAAATALAGALAFIGTVLYVDR